MRGLLPEEAIILRRCFPNTEDTEITTLEGMELHQRLVERGLLLDREYIDRDGDEAISYHTTELGKLALRLQDADTQASR